MTLVVTSALEGLSKDELAGIESAALDEALRLLALDNAQKEIVAAVEAERLRRINDLRRCRTLEEFAAKGYDPDACDFRDYSEGSEYRLRLKHGLPTRSPKLKVGDWAYNPISKENARVVRVIWEAPVATLIGGWRTSVPGYSSYDVGGSYESAPFVEYETTDGTTYRKVPVKVISTAELPVSAFLNNEP